MRYSLSNYILSIEPNDPEIKRLFGTLSIGGEGSVTDSIVISPEGTLFSTTGYATGGWVHNKSQDRHGSASLSINQLSKNVAKFIQLANLYYENDYDGFTLAVSDLAGNKVATCIDCYISSIPSQEFRSTASNQTWSFTCGQINIKS